MATRRVVIEQIIRDIHAGFPTEDTPITENLVNLWLNQGIGQAVKQNYKDAVMLDGIGYINNSFYTTFSDLPITASGNFLWKIVLPHIPLGIGHDEGVNNLVFKDNKNNISLDAVPLTQNQKGYIRTTRPVPSKVLYYTEGKYAYAMSTVLLSNYTANVTLVSGGDSTNLDSELNVPDDYLNVAIEYAVKKGIMQLNGGVRDLANDGELISNKN